MAGRFRRCRARYLPEPAGRAGPPSPRPHHAGPIPSSEARQDRPRHTSNAVRVSEHLVARYGGEEFVIVLSNTNLEKAVEVAEAIRQQVKELKIIHSPSRVSKYVTISLGVSSWVPTEKLSPELMIQEADTALYEAKNLGRDRVIFKTFAPSLNLINAK